MYDGADSFSLVFKLYGDMNLLEVNAWLQRKLESYSNLANLIEFDLFTKHFSTNFVKISITKPTTQPLQSKR
jgi:hypothetical protein